MRYKSNQLVSLFFKEQLHSAQHNLRAFYRLCAGATLRTLHNAAKSWKESMQYRYLRYRYMDFMRFFKLIPPQRYAHLAICLCALMSLGFITTSSPADETPSYFMRVSIERPQVTKVQKVAEQTLFTQEDLRVLREAELTPEQSAWFVATKAKPAQTAADQKQQNSSKVWASSSGLLSLAGGTVTLHTAYANYTVAGMGEVKTASTSTLLPPKNLNGVASGLYSTEALLAELASQSATPYSPEFIAYENILTPPNWAAKGYGAAVFSGPERHWSGAPVLTYGAPTIYAKNADYNGAICQTSRMATASWLALLRLENIAGQSSRQPSKYQEYVERYAADYSIPPSLVYAIMRVESSFNPVAVSTANALGLMQVVPETAGGEVHAYLTGKRGTPKPELLFTPESNIKYGTTYLHLLRDKHFKDVKNPLSRDICVVAAYNCGPSPVYRVFSRDRKKAIEGINALTPDQLYTKLTQKLPAQETRDYLPKVLGARNEFVKGAARF